MEHESFRFMCTRLSKTKQRANNWIDCVTIVDEFSNVVYHSDKEE